MIEEESILDNMEIHKNFAIVSLNPKIYPLSVIFSAAYWLLDKAHVIIDGDPETEILVEMRPRDKDVDLKELGNKFNDELINYAVYTVQSTRNKRLREMIVENALSGNLRTGNPQPPRWDDSNKQNNNDDFCPTCQPETVNDPNDIAQIRKPREKPEDFR
ncbi:MAG: hypothetical protein ABIC91_01485 [Nanoarchaeota archaeon]|nr:hypothetical protein [Nanoarchaeota archaeon]MBU1031108.1 hypothetical protein [Nanoarchaeota archaeon]MBU1849119.1 hypothetical protein [Nanoarchaeota archaeon]